MALDPKKWLPPDSVSELDLMHGSLQFSVHPWAGRNDNPRHRATRTFFRLLSEYAPDVYGRLKQKGWGPVESSTFEEELDRRIEAVGQILRAPDGYERLRQREDRLKKRLKQVQAWLAEAGGLDSDWGKAMQAAFDNDKELIQAYHRGETDKYPSTVAGLFMISREASSGEAPRRFMWNPALEDVEIRPSLCLSLAVLMITVEYDEYLFMSPFDDLYKPITGDSDEEHIWLLSRFIGSDDCKRVKSWNDFFDKMEASIAMSPVYYKIKDLSLDGFSASTIERRTKDVYPILLGRAFPGREKDPVKALSEDIKRYREGQVGH
jgi:hypothetical protein